MGAGLGGQLFGGKIGRPLRWGTCEKGAAALCWASVALQGGCIVGFRRMCRPGPAPGPAPVPGVGRDREALAAVWAWSGVGSHQR